VEFQTAITTSGVDAFEASAVSKWRPDQGGAFQDGLNRALDIMFDWETERFAQFSAHGGDWPDHAPSTKLKLAYATGWRRGRHPRGEPTALEMVTSMEFALLRRTDDLFDSMSSASANHERVFTPTTATGQSTVWYGNYSQSGGAIPGRPPVRQYVVTPPQDVLDAAAIAIAEGMAAAVGE
jgi:hypothetical protein